ncbi:MAG: Phosphopantetheine adenylyltransferase [Chlamydiales bacterium]|nr:Phosphopantetheine adenylyltransferase [Chlamydiales bacterium]MCH9620058.1 Phosphopantetheine adenylyltransferase [Chlamydiales bacterium]MCH9623523.1 Phosphopantetheine adenylyltransferase [Chlamydiales bacterium]
MKKDKTTTAIYPGTFDPPTVGHVDIARRCALFFDKIYIGIGINSSKQQPTFSQKERIELLRRVFYNDPKIEVVAFENLLIDFVQLHSIATIIRSVRTSGDLDFEIAQASLNRQMSGVETFWISAAPEYRDLSSTLIQEIGRGGRPLDHFVPKEIVKDVEYRLTSQ